jgi:hypothetical protein
VGEDAAIKWKLTGVWLAAAFLIFVLVRPLLSLKVGVALPPSATGVPTPQQIASGSHLMASIVTVLIFTVDALLVGLVLWITVKLTRAIRKRRSFR